MNPITYFKLKFTELIIWFKRKWYGDVRPQAVKKPTTRKRQTTSKRKTK